MKHEQRSSHSIDRHRQRCRLSSKVPLTIMKLVKENYLTGLNYGSYSLSDIASTAMTT